MPRICRSSSRLRNGRWVRRATIARAFLGPIPGSSTKAAAGAWLRSRVMVLEWVGLAAQRAIESQSDNMGDHPFQGAGQPAAAADAGRIVRFRPKFGRGFEIRTDATTQRISATDPWW